MIRISCQSQGFDLLAMIFNFRRHSVSQPSIRALEIDGLDIPVILRRNARARRIILKISRKNREIILTMPSGSSEAEAMDFAVSQAHWIKLRIEKQLPGVAFVDGAEIPLRDIIHKVEHKPNQRGTVWTDGEGETPVDETLPVIFVAGDERHLARRLRDWLKQQARLDLLQSVDRHGQQMGLRAKGITIRDQTTRWGSCSSSGVLSFSWRLILAPPHVLDYVAAHEVAHLEEMNHGPEFWKLVEHRLPDYKHAQKWLKQYGAKLHIYG